MTDAVLVLRFITNLEELTLAQLDLADLQGNCKVDVGDAVAILRKAVGLPVE